MQNWWQFFYELEQNSQVRKLNIVTHVRSESQLEQLERPAVKKNQFSASLHEREIVLGSTHVVVCDRTEW